MLQLLVVRELDLAFMLSNIGEGIVHLFDTGFELLLRHKIIHIKSTDRAENSWRVHYLRLVQFEL